VLTVWPCPDNLEVSNQERASHSAGLLVLLAGVTGAAVMIVEVMGVRLMAPWFGQSQLVWTHVIGVVLASLAAGQWLGGRWAETGRGPRPASLLLAAAGLSLALPDLVSWLSQAVLPEDLPLLEAYPFVTLGSLLVSVAALGLPMAALGAVTPWLVRLSRDAGEAPGRVTGRILAAGTLGSLAGTFGATHLLLPALGSAGAVRSAGVLLGAAGLGLLYVSARRGHAASLLALVLVPLGAASLPRQPPLEGLLAEVETPYQWARVVEQPDGTRHLLLNEGLDSFHSVWQPSGVLTGLYYDAMLYAAALAPVSDDERRHVLVVGLAAGTSARQILTLDPGAHVRGVEIDAEIVELGKRWFDLPAEAEVDAGYDGRVVLERDPDRYGAILIDAYAQQIYLPPHLCSREFFAVVRERLLPGGIVTLNIGGLTVEDPVVAAVSETFADVFPGALQGRMPGTRNIIVLGCRGETPTGEQTRAALERWDLLPALDWMLDDAQLTAVQQSGTALLRDGNAPVEALAHASWRGRRASFESSEQSSGDPARDLARARTLMAGTRWTDAEHLLRAALPGANPLQEAEALLLLGNIAFFRDEPFAADAIYRQIGDSVVASEAANIVAVARDNRQLLVEQRERVERLGAHQETLVSWAWAMAIAVLGALAWMGTRSTAGPRGA
jgi:spermidine synthase